MNYILGYLGIMNIAGFCLMGLDKRKAIRHAYRIPEKVLFLAAVLGGSAGSILGMYTFRHKTKHWYFVIGMPVIFALQIGLLAYGLTDGFGKGLPEKIKSVVSIVDIRGTDSTKEGKNEDAGSSIGDSDSSKSKENEAVEDEGDRKEEEKSLINPEGETLKERFLLPEGYKRTKEKKGSLGDFLRNYKMKPDGSPVLLYDGREKGYQGGQAAVFTLPIEAEDLQQCADSVMRVYGEYYYEKGQYDKISFSLGGGFAAEFDIWRRGKGIGVSGNSVYWTNAPGNDSSYNSFKKFMRMVFAYSGTMNLETDSKPVSESEIEIGDIFIHGGSPGHVVMVVDMCEKDGEKAFLLAQGYMPAQEFHVLKNPENDKNPWYYVNQIQYPFGTPEYTFAKGSLRRPKFK